MSDILKDFDKKNEIPKVKLNLPKFDFRHLTETVTNMTTIFENIAKDIGERQDNAMAMEFTKVIATMLRENGVTPIVVEYNASVDNGNSIEMRYGYAIERLDFSEHDEVFEDKIANLEKENKDLKNCFLQREKDSMDMIMKLKQEKSDKNEKIAELACENESLKQRIAELEGKETESVNEMPDSITIDGYKCKIVKTESGFYISRDEIYSIIDKEKEPFKQKCKELEDRHQSDCIKINRLNTTIDVLIHKVEYLRQFAGLE